MGKNKFYRSPQTYMYAWRMFSTIIRFSFVYYARAHLLRRYSFAVSLSLSSSMSLCFILIRIVNIFLWFLLFCFFFCCCMYRPNWLFFYSYGKSTQNTTFMGNKFCMKERNTLGTCNLVIFIIFSRVHVYIHTLHILYFMRFILVESPLFSGTLPLCLPYFVIQYSMWIELKILHRIYVMHISRRIVYVCCFFIFCFFVFYALLVILLRFASGLEMWKFALFPSIYLFIWHQFTCYGRTFASLF